MPSLHVENLPTILPTRYGRMTHPDLAQRETMREPGFLFCAFWLRLARKAEFQKCVTSIGNFK